jgi:glycerophosphoryl diester phosphodiesterase
VPATTEALVRYLLAGATLIVAVMISTPSDPTTASAATSRGASAGASASGVAAAWRTLDGRPPLVIAHRGASGYRPEHTLESYRLAIEMGADFIEPDLVSTADGHLVARHEPDITATTDVASRAEFAGRRTTRVVDGVSTTGWFTVDFTLAELRTLRAVQPRADRSTAYDGRFPIPTLEEIAELAQRESRRLGRPIGIYPETQHPTWHCELGLPLEPALLAALGRAGWTTRDAPVFIQSFESGNLKWLRARTGVRLVQLIDAGGLADDGSARPGRDWTSGGGCRLFTKGELPRDYTQADAFATIARYADAVGPWKRLLVGSRPDAQLAAATPAAAATEAVRRTVAPTRFVALAHAAGLAVHPWTFRNEPSQLAADYGGEPLQEYREFYALGVDGVFSDFPDTAIAARAAATPSSGG